MHPALFIKSGIERWFKIGANLSRKFVFWESSFESLSKVDFVTNFVFDVCESFIYFKKVIFLFRKKFSDFAFEHKR